MMQRWLILAGAGLLGICALAFWLLRPKADAPRTAPDLDPVIEAASLAVKGISLLQGEKGFESWRLKAEWAAMRREDDAIDVYEPKVRYTLGESGSVDYVYVSSELGRVTDGQRVLTLWQDVRLIRGDAVVTGPKLVYTANDRVALLSDGADFDGPEAFGTFTRLRWAMNRNRMDGEDGVDVTFKARAPKADEGARPETPDVGTGAGPDAKE
jgi:hypothetical protein